MNQLVKLYNLTDAESVFLMNFVNTPDANKIAANTHRSVETVRKHLKAVMDKMDVHNQAELMKRVLWEL